MYKTKRMFVIDLFNIDCIYLIFNRNKISILHRTYKNEQKRLAVFKNYVIMMILGCRQAVRLGSLNPACVGSNPTTPAKHYFKFLY